jgi:hypothetical protein
MGGAVDTASIALSVAAGTSLLGGWFSISVAMRSGTGAAVQRDRLVSILFGIALLLLLLNVSAAALIAAWGMAYVGLLKAALLLTAAFAAVGMVCGMIRGLRSGKAIKPRTA